MKYPERSGFVEGSATSQEAADHVDDTGAAQSQLDEVERLVHAAKYKGLTADEARADLEKDWPFLHNAIVSARLSRLVNLGRIVKTNSGRQVSTGRRQTIYVHTDFADLADIKPLQSAKQKTDFLKEIDPVLRAIYNVLEEGKVPRIEPGGPFHNKLKGRYQ